MRWWKDTSNFWSTLPDTAQISKIQVEIAFHCSGKQQKKPNSTKSGPTHLLSGHTHLKVERCFTNTMYFSKKWYFHETPISESYRLIKYKAPWRNCSKNCPRRALRSDYLAQILQTRQSLPLVLFSGCCSLWVNRPSSIFNYTVTNSQGEGIPLHKFLAVQGSSLSNTTSAHSCQH